MNKKLNFNYVVNNHSVPVPPYSRDFELDAEEKVVQDLFDETEDALFDLYEELFNTSSKIDTKRIYNAMKYLLWKKGMTTQHEDMETLTEHDICVRHISDVDSEVKERLSYFKNIVTEVVEDYV